MAWGLCKSLGSKLRIGLAIDYDLPHPCGVLMAPIWLPLRDRRALLMECSSC